MRTTHRTLTAWGLLIAIFLLGAAQTTQAQQGQKTVSLEDIWQSYRFYASSPNDFHWAADGQHYFVQNEALTILKQKPGTDQPVEVMVTVAQMLGQSKGSQQADEQHTTQLGAKTGRTPHPIEAFDSFEFSPGEDKVLIQAQTKPIFRRSRQALCYVYDRKTGHLDTVQQGQPVSNPTFSPDGTKLAYTYQNNLYYLDLTTHETRQLTTDGVVNKIINGSTDWVYEEEFSLVQAYAWSPDSKRIAYLQFDETNVPKFTIQYYKSNLYPQNYTYKYPKAGEKNSIVHLLVVGLDDKHTEQVAVGTDADQYIPRFYWTGNPNQLAVFRMNRLQNRLDILLADAATGASHILLTEQDAAYVEIIDDKIIFLQNGKQFVYLSEQDGYNHAYLYDYTAEGPAKLNKQITKGPWEITDFYGVDEANGTLYFQSTEPGATQRAVYSIALDGSGKKALTQGDGWHSHTYSPTFAYYMHSFSADVKPGVYTLEEKGGKVITTLEDNQTVASALKEYKLSPKTYFTCKADDGTELNGYMLKPLDFKKKKKYPVLMFCYGGPGAQTVTNEYDPFDFFWFQHLAAQGYVVVSVDNRGTGARGAAFRKATYKNLGKLELADQTAAARYLQTQSFVDGKRIGIWGWSFGGYLTSLCLTKQPDVFALGVAVAPVTNWRFYDTIYTERFLQTPAENPQGYDENSPLNYAANLKGKYLLVHGLADDNVHYQNAAAMINALVANNKSFEQLTYPDRNHGIYGGKTRLHLFQKMTDFIVKNL